MEFVSFKPYNKAYHATLVFIMAILLAIVAGNRLFGIDRDFYQYQLFFEQLNNNIHYDDRFELGFVTYTKLFILATDGLTFNFFLWLTAFIALVIKIKLISERPLFILNVVLYCFLLFPLHEMTQIRLAMSIAFIYYGLSGIKDGFNVKSCLFLILGFLFHYSSLILMPFVLYYHFFNRLRFSLQIVSLVVIPSLLLYYGVELSSSLNPLAINYLSDGFAEPVNIFSVRNITLALAVFIGFCSWSEINDESRLFLIVSLFGIVLFSVFHKFPTYAHRFLEMTIFGYFFWISHLPIRRKIILYSFFIPSSLYLFYRCLFLDPFFS